ncbi:MAG: hypothetical protein ACXU8N_18270 [Telluria sp.]
MAKTGNTLPYIPGPKQYRINFIADQAALNSLVGPRRQERLRIQVRGQLALQDDLVAVSIQGHRVGHLSRSNTQALHRIVRYGERSPHETFECAALITGVVGQLGVRLDLPFEDD